MSKRNWMILGIVIIVGAMVIFSGITYLMNHGGLSRVTLSGSTSTTTGSSIGLPAQTPNESQPTESTAGESKSAVSENKLTPEDQKKLSILNEIFVSRNDNDPRMDSELVRLSPELKQAMAKTYQDLAPEKRNERGTIAFLIGREIKSTEDVDFLKNILMEKPCLSLGDCSKHASASSEEDVHLDGMNELTANYPQVMALRQMVASYRKLIDQNGSSPEAARIVQALNEALHSPNAHIADEARRALTSIGKSPN